MPIPGRVDVDCRSDARQGPDPTHRRRELSNNRSPFVPGRLYRGLGQFSSSCTSVKKKSAQIEEGHESGSAKNPVKRIFPWGGHSMWRWLQSWGVSNQSQSSTQRNPTMLSRSVMGSQSRAVSRPSSEALSQAPQRVIFLVPVSGPVGFFFGLTS